jgi:hypothetical protein
VITGGAVFGVGVVPGLNTNHYPDQCGKRPSGLWLSFINWALIYLCPIFLTSAYQKQTIARSIQPKIT